MATHQRLTVGWREWIRLPQLGVERIKVKVDSGARSSSLHAFEIEYFERLGEPWVKFQIPPLQNRDRPVISAAAKLLEMRSVRSSNGLETERPVVVTDLELGGMHWPIELTLSPRDEMGFRMLLGREALRGRVRIDPGRSYLASLAFGFRPHRFRGQQP
jgi:hypothetical protein